MKALTRACLSIVADTWSKLEKENYTQCIGSVVEAEALSIQSVNPRTCGNMEALPDSNWPRISDFWIDASFYLRYRL